MPDIPWLAVLRGLGLGALASGVFFAGLAWGLQRALRARQPALVLLPSFLLRAALLLGAGWWLTLQRHPAWSLPAYVLAFFIVRAVALQRARRGSATPVLDPRENG